LVEGRAGQRRCELAYARRHVGREQSNLDAFVKGFIAASKAQAQTGSIWMRGMTSPSGRMSMQRRNG
jgi:hypothetical protein